MQQIRRLEAHRLLAGRLSPPLIVSLLICFCAAAPAALGQGAQPEALTIPAGTPIEARLVRHIPMKAGQPVQAALAHAVYADNRLAFPEGALLHGSVVSLESNRELRTDARLNADFTPYHKPTVTFTSVTLPDGTSVPLATMPSSDGAPVIRLAPASAQSRSLIGKGVDAVKGW